VSAMQIMTNPKNPRGQLLHMREAAKSLRISESHLRRLLLDGKGPPAFKRPGSNQWLFWGSELDAWMESGRVSRSA
jgi:excisionase family DNA binding protein